MTKSFLSGLLASIFLFSIVNTSFAQEAGEIHGLVLSKSQPLPYANILLYTSSDSLKPLHAIMTDTTGRFSFKNLPLGNYFLHILLIGHQTEKRPISIDKLHKTIDLGSIHLTIIASELESIKIVGQKKLIEKTAEGFVINSSANLTQQGGTLTDLLRSTPTIVVDGEGAITLRGKTPLILINGRNSSFSNTDHIAANSIESIEIINNPSAKYDASAEAGIINIKLKKNKQNGFNSSVILGSGYGARGRFNSSLLLNNKEGKFNVGLSYDNRFAGRERNMTGDRINYFIPESYSLQQTRADSRLESLQNMRLTIDFTPNEKNTIGFEALGNSSGEDNHELLTSTISTQLHAFNSKATRLSLENTKEKGAEFALNFERKYNDKRKSLTSSISSSFGNNKQHTDIISQALNQQNDFLGNEFLQQTKDNELTNVTNIKTDFIQPISEKSSFQTGYKSTIRHLDADFKSLDKINNSYVENPFTSNRFVFNEQIHAGYLQYSAFTGKKDNPLLKYDVGLRGEQVWNDGHVVTNDVSFKNNYFKLFPSASIAYFKEQDEFWKVNYSRRITRPGLGQLNPFIDITDSLNQHGGNANLKPELIQSFELGYNKDWSKVTIYSVLFYRHSTDAIRYFTMLKSNGVALSLPINFGNVSSYGLENIFTLKASRVYDFNVSLSTFQQHYNGAIEQENIAKNVFCWYGKWINNINVWNNGKLQVAEIYNSPLATPQGSRVAIYYTDLGFQQKIGKGKGRIGLILSDLFNTQRNGYIQNTKDFSFTRKSKIDTRAILLTFAYSFGTTFKEKFMENKFQNE